MENSGTRIPSSFIPFEVWYEILKRLPIKSLSRFRCVSKAWNSFIRSPNFIAAHHAAASASAAGNTHLFVQIGGLCDQSLDHNKHLLIDLKPLERGLNFLQPSRTTIPSYVIVLAYADGVLLGVVRLGNEFHHVLCNPAINRYVLLPEPVSRRSHCYSWYQLGLGFVPSKNDIGVVKITYDKDDRNREFIFPPIVKVCYARERVWRTIAPDVASTYLISKFPNHTCCTNGRVHWVVKSRYENSKCVPCCVSEQLMVFDFEGERFETLDLPAELVKDLRWQISKITLLLFKQNLSVLFHGSQNYSLWSLTAYPDVSSWAKLWSNDRVTQELFTAFMGWRADYILIVSRDKEGITGVYDPDVDSSRESYVFPFEGESVHHVWGFDESLFLLDEETQALPLTQMEEFV